MQYDILMYIILAMPIYVGTGTLAVICVHEFGAVPGDQDLSPWAKFFAVLLWPALIWVLGFLFMWKASILWK